MTLRQKFEKRWPCPQCTHWDGTEYRINSNYSFPTPAHIKHQARWEAYQAAMDDAVPDGWVVVPKEPTEHMVREGLKVPWLDATEEDIRTSWANMLSSTQEDDQ